MQMCLGNMVMIFSAVTTDVLTEMRRGLTLDRREGSTRVLTTSNNIPRGVGGAMWVSVCEPSVESVRPTQLLGRRRSAMWSV
jgi:hypothetical protein